MSITADPPPGSEHERLMSQAEQLARRRRSRERRFALGVRVSYVVLFALLALLFSGLDLRPYNIPFRTIQLD